MLCGAVSSMWCWSHRQGTRYLNRRLSDWTSPASNSVSTRYSVRTRRTGVGTWDTLGSHSLGWAVLLPATITRLTHSLHESWTSEGLSQPFFDFHSKFETAFMISPSQRSISRSRNSGLLTLNGMINHKVFRESFWSTKLYLRKLFPSFTPGQYWMSPHYTHQSTYLMLSMPEDPSWTWR